MNENTEFLIYEDIDKYQAEYKGLNMRQLRGIVIVGVTGVLLFLLFHFIFLVPMLLATWMALFLCVPVAICLFLRVEELSFLEFISRKWQYAYSDGYHYDSDVFIRYESLLNEADDMKEKTAKRKKVIKKKKNKRKGKTAEEDKKKAKKTTKGKTKEKTIKAVSDGVSLDMYEEKSELSAMMPSKEVTEKMKSDSEEVEMISKVENTNTDNAVDENLLKALGISGSDEEDERPKEELEIWQVIPPPVSAKGTSGVCVSDVIENNNAGHEEKASAEESVKEELLRALSFSGYTEKEMSVNKSSDRLKLESSLDRLENMPEQMVSDMPSNDTRYEDDEEDKKYRQYLYNEERVGKMKKELKGIDVASLFGEKKDTKEQERPVTKPAEPIVKKVIEQAVKIEPEASRESLAELTSAEPFKETTLLYEAQEQKTGFALRSIKTGKISKIYDGIQIGRNPNLVDMVIADNSTVSGKHARISVKEKTCLVQDLKSSNGTYINDVRLQPDFNVEAKEGSIIKFSNEEYELIRI